MYYKAFAIISSLVRVNIYIINVEIWKFCIFYAKFGISCTLKGFGNYLFIKRSAFARSDSFVYAVKHSYGRFVHCFCLFNVSSLWFQSGSTKIKVPDNVLTHPKRAIMITDWFFDSIQGVFSVDFKNTQPFLT